MGSRPDDLCNESVDRDRHSQSAGGAKVIDRVIAPDPVGAGGRIWTTTRPADGWPICAPSIQTRQQWVQTKLHHKPILFDPVGETPQSRSTWAIDILRMSANTVSGFVDGVNGGAAEENA